MDQTVEQVAQALRPKWFDGSVAGEPYREAARADARVAIKALREPTGDVIRLVIAARNVAYDERPSREALKELDQAAEAFADRVPWDGEPTSVEGDDDK